MTKTQMQERARNLARLRHMEEEYRWLACASVALGMSYEEYLGLESTLAYIFDLSEVQS